MSLVEYIDRQNTDSVKWDGQTEMYGDEGLLAMWVADMDFKVPPCVLEALHAYIDEGTFGYYKAPKAYHQAFIDWEREHHNYEVKEEWIRFSPGVVAAFNWVIQFMTRPEDAVIVTTPVYYPFMHAVTNNGCRLVTSDLINTNGIYTIDFADFEKKIIDNQVKVFILCSPHNPVGRVWTYEELKTLLDICRRHHVFVISDEIHHDLVYASNTHIPSSTVGDYDDMLITLTAPSKTFNLAGCQNSIIIIPDEQIRAKWDAHVEKCHITSGNAFGYIAATAAYTDGFAWLEEVKDTIYGNYLYVKNMFAKALPNVIVSPLEGTYLLWIDMKEYLTSDTMKDFMQNKCRLAFDYGDWFGGTQFGTCIRMNLATSRENIETAVRRIIEHI